MREETVLKNKEDKEKTNHEEKEAAYKKIRKSFQRDNEKLIKQFNFIYKELMSKSSCKSDLAEIDEEYMPYIDRGKYKEHSAIVPIRLIYFFYFS